MATLTETAYYSRRIIKWSIIGLIFLIIARILFYTIVDAVRRAFPPQPLKVDNRFGKLPHINFPASASASAELTYSLQTTTGTVPDLPQMARIFFMPKNKHGFLTLSNAQNIVAKIGFTATPRQINTDTYRWIDMKNPLRILEMDIVNQHFVLKYAYVHDLTLFVERQIPSSAQALQEASAFLQKMDLSISDINFKSAQTKYLKLVGDKLETTLVPSQADAVRLDLFHQDYQNMKVVTEKLDQGQIYFIFSGSKTQDRRMIEGHFNYWPIDMTNTGVYNLKSGNQAYDELQTGDAYFATLPENISKIAITDVFLAYFDSKQSQTYLQPVFVFVGEQNFAAYVPAVASPWSE